MLQITLNFLGVDSAIKAAKNAVDNVEWICVGNSLIKSEGIKAISRIKEEFLDATDFQSGACLRGGASQPHKKIVADMMIMEFPAEVEMASRAGADIITVSGMSDDKVLLGCVNAGKINGTEIIADLRGLNFSKEKIKILEKTGVNYLLLDCRNLGDMDRIYNYAKILPMQGRHTSEFEGFSRIPIIAECPVDSETVTYAIEAGASIIALKLNNKDDLQKFAEIKEVIRNRIFVRDQDIWPTHGFEHASESEGFSIPAEEEFEKIIKVLGGIRKALADMEIQRSIDMDRRKKLDEETKKLEDEKREIAVEWRKLKEMEIHLEEKKKLYDEGCRKKEDMLLKLEDEQKRKWEAISRKNEIELNRIEQELSKIKRAGDIIETQRIKIADEMRKIEEEWERIEKITGKTGEKEKSDKGNKPDEGGVKIIGEYNTYKKDEVSEPLGDIETTEIKMYHEKNIEGDLLRIKEEHKRRTEI